MLPVNAWPVYALPSPVLLIGRKEATGGAEGHGAGRATGEGTVPRRVLARRIFYLVGHYLAGINYLVGYCLVGSYLVRYYLWYNIISF